MSVAVPATSDWLERQRGLFPRQISFVPHTPYHKLVFCEEWCQQNGVCSFGPTCRFIHDSVWVHRGRYHGVTQLWLCDPAFPTVIQVIETLDVVFPPGLEPPSCFALARLPAHVDVPSTHDVPR